MQEEHCELLPYCTPKQVILNDDGKICAIEMYKTEQNDDGSYSLDDGKMKKKKRFRKLTLTGKVFFKNKKKK